MKYKITVYFPNGSVEAFNADHYTSDCGKIRFIDTDTNKSIETTLPYFVKSTHAAM